MTRLLVGRRWFDLVAPTSIYEVDFEAALAEAAPLLFPGWHFVGFKLRLVTSRGPTAGDFVLVDEEYRGWYLVEVELSHHPLAGHVLPQLERLGAARFSEREADFLAAREPRFDRERLRLLLKNTRPRVLLIADELPAEWEPEVHRLGVYALTIKILRTDRNEVALLGDGHWPQRQERLLSSCRVSVSIPSLLVVETPAALMFSAGDQAIAFDGESTLWAELRTGDQVLLVPRGRFPLPAEVDAVNLLRDEDGRLRFERRKGRSYR